MIIQKRDVSRVQNIWVAYNAVFEVDETSFRCGHRGTDTIGFFTPEDISVGADFTFATRITLSADGFIQKWSDHNGIVEHSGWHHEAPAITLGGDPEFELVIGDSVGCPDEDDWGTTGDSIGLDGAGEVIELRPHYGRSVDSIIRNMRELMEEACDMGAVFSARGDTYATGGHIHIGYGFEYVPSGEELALLDKFVGHPSQLANGTARGGYARTGSYEVKSYGYEYRSPSAAVYANPRICKMTFQVVHDVLTRFHNGETFVLASNEHPARIRDLRMYTSLTERESREYLRFFREFRSKPVFDCVAAWTRGEDCRCLSSTEVFISLGDDWGRIARQTFKDVLGGYLEEHGIHVHLFGLSPDRGNVTYGFTSSQRSLVAQSTRIDICPETGERSYLEDEKEMHRIEDVTFYEHMVDAGTLVFGLPKFVRKPSQYSLLSSPDNDILAYIRRMATDILETIQEGR